MTVLDHLNAYDEDVMVLDHLNVNEEYMTVLFHLNVGLYQYMMKIWWT